MSHSALSFSFARYGSDLVLAAKNLWGQKTRTILTALGIIFGVGAVIGMLAIGAGAREESLQFIQQLGVRNLLYLGIVLWMGWMLFRNEGSVAAEQR